MKNIHSKNMHLRTTDLLNTVLSKKTLEFSFLFVSLFRKSTPFMSYSFFSIAIYFKLSWQMSFEILINQKLISLKWICLVKHLLAKYFSIKAWPSATAVISFHLQLQLNLSLLFSRVFLLQRHYKNVRCSFFTLSSCHRCHRGCCHVELQWGCLPQASLQRQHLW